MISYLNDSDTIAATLADLGLPPAKAARLAATFPRLRGMDTATPGMLRAAGGLTERQARCVAAAMRLSRTASMARDAYRSPIGDPDAFAAFLRAKIGRDDAECFVAIPLDAQNRAIDMLVIHRGTVSRVDVHPREVFRPAVNVGAHSLIVAHNHPSGSPEPSPADYDLTQRLADTGRLLGIPLVDHLVIAASDHVSMAARGYDFSA